MTATAGRVIALAFAVGLAPGCAREAPAGDGAGGHSYLYVFAGDDDKRAGDTDFLGVIDADPASPTYARVVATAPIRAVGTMPHHMELAMPGHGQWLFANGFMSGRTFLFDLSNALAPRVAATVESIPGFVRPHSFWRLSRWPRRRDDPVRRRHPTGQPRGHCPAHAPRSSAENRQC